MLEEIALSISTALFFICTIVVSAVLPMPRDGADLPAETVVHMDESFESYTVPTSVRPMDITGEWSCNGKIFVFTRDGKLLFGNHSADYCFSDGKLTVTFTVGDKKRDYTAELEQVNSKLIKLNGTPLYRVK